MITGFIDKFKSKRQSFICQNFKTELRHLLRVFQEQLASLVVKFLCLLRQQTGKAFCSHLTRVWRRSIGGTGGESVNSAGYSLIE